MRPFLFYSILFCLKHTHAHRVDFRFGGIRSSLKLTEGRVYLVRWSCQRVLAKRFPRSVLFVCASVSAASRSIQSNTKTKTKNQRKRESNEQNFALLLVHERYAEIVHKHLFTVALS